MEHLQVSQQMGGVAGGLPVCCWPQWRHGGATGGTGSVRAALPESARAALSCKEDLQRGDLTWPPLAVLGEELLVHFPLLLLLFDLGFLVDLLDGLGALVRSPGHPVVLEAGETKTWRGTLAWQDGGNDI